MDQFAAEVMSTVPPTLRVEVEGVRVMDVRVTEAAFTVMVAVLDTLPRLAVMVAVPAATAVTTPPASTVATEGAELIQVR